MINTICLNEKYSTTKILTKEKPIIENGPEDKFETFLFLPEGENRKGEGGLRTKGYFKKSYDDKPLISIITVVFNGEKYLEQTIQSVIGQNYDNVEYIIIDGGSNDGTVDIIKKYEDQIDYWVSEEDRGIYDAMNKGSSLCSGEYVGFLNADDWYVLDALGMIAKYLMHEKPGYIFGDTALYENECYKNTMKSNLAVYRKRTPIGHQALFVQRKYLLKDPFEIKFERYADYDFMIKIIDSGLEYIQLDFVVVNYRLGGFSSTGNLNKEKFFIQYIHFGLIYALYYYIKRRIKIRERMKFLIVCLKKFFRWECKY